MTDQASLWGDRNPWRPDDNARSCYTCGHAPVGRYSDGSPRYPATCRHAPVYRPDAPLVPQVGLVHTLSARDQGLAQSCGEQRNHGQDRWGRKALDAQGRLAANVVGAAGEIAFARLTGLPFRCMANQGYGKPDVGRYGVRTRRRQDAELILHEQDRGPQVLMVQVAPWSFRLVGWLHEARDGQDPRWWSDPGGRRPAWFVPQDALDSPLGLPELAPGRVASTPSGT